VGKCQGFGERKMKIEEKSGICEIQAQEFMKFKQLLS